MSVICPTILASSEAEYASQMSKIASLGSRIQIDLMDGEFASPRSVELEKVWWPPHLLADIHLMYQRPMEYLNKLKHLKPHMVIIHFEADIDHMHFAAELHKENIKAGLAILPDTQIKNVENLLTGFDHLLIFSGDLGRFGGQADLHLLPKAREAKQNHPDLEVGWDGGVNDRNAKQLADGGVDILNVGGFIQSSEKPSRTFDALINSLN